MFLLRQTAAYKDASILRSRDPAVLDQCDIVVDVGAIYDESKQRFDHHQRGFEEVFGHGFETKLSSAGLIYKHFGREIIANRTQLAQQDPKVDTLYLKLYKTFIEAIDAIDNGISQYATTESPRYQSRTDLSSRVGWLNPAWNEKADAAKVDALFEQASSLTGTEFLNRLDHFWNSWFPAREIVSKAYHQAKAEHPSGRIIVFQQFAPWKAHLFDIESEAQLAEDKKPLYVVYPDEMGGSWRVQAVPGSSESFESRKALPESWRGIRDNELSTLTGIPDCIFVHASGFIGGNKTKAGAMALATKALEWTS